MNNNYDLDLKAWLVYTS